MPQQVTIRRRRGRKPNALTAAAQRVDANNPASFRTSTGGRGGNWQQEAWDYLEKVGELQYYVSWRAFSASRCRLVASALDDQGAPLGHIPDDTPSADTVRKIVNDIAGGVSGQAKLIHRAAYLLTVVGECWAGMVVRDAAREQSPDGNDLPVDLSRPGYALEQWYVFGRDQIKSSSSGIELKLPDGSKHEFNPDVDVLFRIWQEHPQDPSQPVSPIWSTRVVLNGIVQSSATMEAANNSRLVGNGILLLPQELSLPRQNAPVAVPVGTPDTNDPPPYFEPNTAQDLLDQLADIAAIAKKDPSSAAATLPMIVQAAGEYLDKVQWLRAGSDIPETTLKIQEADIRRLAMGLDVAPERLLGMGDGNHWSAWAIDESDIKIHVAPVVELIAQAFTQEILRQKLAEAGIDPDLFLVWYDTTALTQDPDKTDEARDAFDRGAITAAALRTHLGFDDEDGYDLTTSDGWIQLALDKIALDPANAQVFMPILEAAASKVGLDVGSPAPAALPTAPAQPDATPQPQAQPANEPTSPPPASSVQAAAVTIARIYVNRALELANKRRLTRTDRGQLRGVPIELAHTRLDALPLPDAMEFIRGWSTGMDADDLVQLGIVPADFKSLVEGVASLALATASPPVITSSMIRRAA